MLRSCGSPLEAVVFHDVTKGGCAAPSLREEGGWGRGMYAKGKLDDDFTGSCVSLTGRDTKNCSRWI